MAETSTTLYALNPECQGYMRLYLLSPRARQVDPVVEARFTHWTPAMAHQLLSYFYRVAVRHGGPPAQQRQQLRGLGTYLAQRFGPAAVPEPILALLPQLGRLAASP